MATAIIDVQSAGNTVTVFDELTPAEANPPAGPLTREESEAIAAGMETIICWYTAADDIHLESHHWPAVMVRRAELGRPLGARDLRSIVDADGGVDVQD